MPHTHWFSMKRFLSRVNLCKYRLRAKVIVPFYVCVNFVLHIHISNRMVFLLNFAWKWNGSSYFQCVYRYTTAHTHTNRIPSILSYLSSMEMGMNTLLLYRTTHRLKNPADFFFLQTNSHFQFNTTSLQSILILQNIATHGTFQFRDNKQRLYKKQFLRIHISRICILRTLFSPNSNKNRQRTYFHTKMQQHNLRQNHLRNDIICQNDHFSVKFQNLYFSFNSSIDFYIVLIIYT